MHESSSSSSSDTSEPLARSDSASTINVSNKSSRSRGVSSKGFAITLTRPPPPTSSSSNKRRRQNKEEQAFNAANIQQSLADAGRPPMSIQGRRERALPKYLGAVDMDTAKLITSTQFENENEDTPSSSSSSSVNDKYDVQSMNMYANLIQSTRHYYTVSNDEDIATTTTTVRPHHHAPAKTQSLRKQSSTSYNNENDEDNSGMSTWTPPTPTSALNDSLNDYLRQNIDNDNRSDGLSSDMADNSTSSDSLSSCSDDGSTADDPQQDEQEEDEKDRFAEHITIVG